MSILTVERRVMQILSVLNYSHRIHDVKYCICIFFFLSLLFYLLVRTLKSKYAEIMPKLLDLLFGTIYIFTDKFLVRKYKCYLPSSATKWLDVAYALCMIVVRNIAQECKVNCIPKLWCLLCCAFYKYKIYNVIACTLIHLKGLILYF